MKSKMTNMFEEIEKQIYKIESLKMESYVKQQAIALDSNGMNMLCTHEKLMMFKDTNITTIFGLKIYVIPNAEFENGFLIADEDYIQRLGIEYAKE